MDFSRWRDRWHFPRTPAAAAWWAAAFVLLLSAYANLALLVGRKWLVCFPPFRSGVDANSITHLGAEYLNIAIAIVEGRGFADPFGVPTGPTAWMPPVYPVLLAGLLRVLPSHAWVAAAVVLLQNATWVATAAFVFSLARATARRLPPAAALVFPAIWMLAQFQWFFQITHDVWIVMLAVDAVLWCGWRLVSNATRSGAGLAFGVAGGMAALISPIVGFGFGVLALVLGASRPRLRRRIAGALMVAAAIAAPWAARNYLVFGELILVKSNLAFDAYQANFVSESGVYDEPQLLEHPVWTTVGDPDSLYAVHGEGAFVASYRASFLAAARAQPRTVIRKAARRLAAATLVYRPYQPDIEGAHPPLASLLLPLPLIGLLAAFAWAREPRPPLLGIALAIYAGIVVPYALVAFYIRYLLPLTPVLALFVFWGADAVAARREGVEIDKPSSNLGDSRGVTSTR